MWPFNCRRRQTKSCKLVKRLVTGLIIGGAIGSVVGKKLIEKHDEEIEDDGNSTD
jgi:hypothetical protein|tara:strand:- start:3309 stop:3473 length:165 start_codon:yes stop_codon:yes gene_type:complete